MDLNIKDEEDIEINLHMTEKTDLNVKSEQDVENNLPARKKKVYVTAKDKMEILKQLDEGCSGAVIAQKYGLHESTLRKWKKKRKRIEDSYKRSAKTKRLHNNPNDKLNKALFVWFREMRSKGLTISGTILKEKALLLHQILGGSENFAASDGWLSYWKKRHGVRHVIVNNGILSLDKQWPPDENLKSNQTLADQAGLNTFRTLASREECIAAGILPNDSNDDEDYDYDIEINNDDEDPLKDASLENATNISENWLKQEPMPGVTVILPENSNISEEVTAKEALEGVEKLIKFCKHLGSINQPEMDVLRRVQQRILQLNVDL